jgi:YegS/Rv2252/BmrU family lipid kinase
MKEILFILNPVAGIRRISDLESIIKDNLDLTRYSYEINTTSRQGEALEITRQAIQKGYDIVTAVGGDGTINEIAKGIEGSDVVLGIVPNGSGNGLARHLEIPLDIARAIRFLNDGRVRRIDTATMNGMTFVSLAGVGFDARVANRYRKIRRRGFYGYFRIIVQEYFGYKEQNYTLEIDGKLIERKALLVTVTNSNQFGYGTVIAPAAKLDDGLLNVIIVRKFPLAELPLVLQLLYGQRIDKSQYVESITGKEIQIIRKRGRWVNLDGEAIKTDLQVAIRMNPASLQVLAPTNKD